MLHLLAEVEIVTGIEIVPATVFQLSDISPILNVHTRRISSLISYVQLEGIRRQEVLGAAGSASIRGYNPMLPIPGTTGTYNVVHTF